MIIGVVGLGYLGATHAAVMADLGFEVIGIEPNLIRASAIMSGKAPFFEPGLDKILAKTVSRGKLRVLTEWGEEASKIDAFFICVGTPQSPDGLATNKSYLYSAIDEIAKWHKSGATVIGKSTVPVGTASELQERLSQLSDRSFHYAWNPEFLREGKAVGDTRNPDRLVFGGSDPAAFAVMRKIYQQTISEGTPVIETNLASAELVKVAANAFLATKISFINAIAEVAEVSGADVTEIADAIGLDKRIGRKFLNAGIGFGGGCLPKDIRSFIHRTEELGLGESFQFLREVDHLNTRQRARVVQIVNREFEGDLIGRKIAVLGGAFKPNSDDIRDSPALDISQVLKTLGANVHVYDPAARANIAAAYPELVVSESIEDAVTDSEMILHLTEWSVFKKISAKRMQKKAAKAVLFDGRNTLDHNAWRKAGWKVIAVGKGASKL